jgi:hypothetical protein
MNAYLLVLELIGNMTIKTAELQTPNMLDSYARFRKVQQQRVPATPAPAPAPAPAAVPSAVKVDREEFEEMCRSFPQWSKIYYEEEFESVIKKVQNAAAEKAAAENAAAEAKVTLKPILAIFCVCSKKRMTVFITKT